MEKKNVENLQLERGIGRMAAIMLCFNGIVGSGIFVSPKGQYPILSIYNTKSRSFGVNINLRNIGSSRNTGFLNDYVVHLWITGHLWRSLLCRNRLCYTKNRRWIPSFGSCLWTNASIFICMGKLFRSKIHLKIPLMSHNLWVISYE